MLDNSLFQKLLTITVCVYLSFFSLVHAEPSAKESIVYAAVADNPAYSAVTKLAFREADKKITYGDDPSQFGLLWLADNVKPNNTLVVFIHGGCWISAFDITHTYAASTAIAQAGYPVWSIEYRRAGDSGGGWPTTFEDIKLGIAKITELAELGVKFDNVVLAGHSAGGHLALLSGATIKNILPETSLTFSIAGLAAITDINAYTSAEGSCNSGGLKFMGGTAKDKPDDYIKANPANYLIKKPTILFQGKKDPIVPMSQAEALTSGANIQRLYVDGAGHFDWVHPGTTAFRKFLDYLTAQH